MCSKKIKRVQVGKCSNNNSVKSSFIPKYEINSNKGDDSLILTLKKNMAIINNYGCMSWMDNDINIETSSRGGIFKGLIIRSIFTSASMTSC